MAHVFDWERIREVVGQIDLLGAMEEGFVAYSEGRVVVPPVGELLFEKPPGDVHIKYGYITGDEYFVVKVASSFYDNVAKGLPSSSGLMLLFDQRTGILAAVMLDEGHLTNLRTAAAGAVVARYLAPRKVHRIGVLGTGIQARLQVEHLQGIVDCRDVVVWGRDDGRLEQYRTDMEARGYRVETAREPGDVAMSANLIVTATPSTSPLLRAEHVRPGTHITAVGSDTPEKVELDPLILARADLVVADSVEQCRSRGEIHQATRAGCLREEKVLELGNVIRDPALRRSSEDQFTVADLTGVAVQDLQIAKAVYRALRP